MVSKKKTTTTLLFYQCHFAHHSKSSNPFGTLLVQHGKIVASERGSASPANTVIVDLEGKHLYPSFIDCYTAFGVENQKGGQSRAFTTI